MSERPKSNNDAPGSRDSAKEPAKQPYDRSAGERMVFVIDDDISMRRALTNLFQSVATTRENAFAARRFTAGSLPCFPLKG